MTTPLFNADEVLRQVGAVDATTPIATLRTWRNAIVRASVLVSYALGIYSLDVKILERADSTYVNDVLSALVDDLPELLATGWVGGGWSLSPDASISVAAADELDVDSVARQLELHGVMVSSDLSDHAVVRDLILRIEEQRSALAEIKDKLAHQLQLIQKTVLERYATGDASVNDWLA